MLDRVDIKNVRTSATLLTLTLSDPSNGFVVQEIEGLGPVKATIHSSTFAGLDGERYHGSRRDIRNIVFTIGLKHNTLSIKSLRARLYQVFMPKSEIIMSYHMKDNSYVDIAGVVETCEPTMFTKEPSMTVSIICHQSDFISPIVGTVSGLTTQSVNNTEFEYTGTVPTGFTYTLTATSTIQKFALLIDSVLGSEILWCYLPMNAGDTATISTVKGSRSARILRNGQTVSSSALYAVANDAVWPELQPGTNKFRSWADVENMSYNLAWKPRYGGL